MTYYFVTDTAIVDDAERMHKAIVDGEIYTDFNEAMERANDLNVWCAADFYYAYSHVYSDDELELRVLKAFLSYTVTAVSTDTPKILKNYRKDYPDDVEMVKEYIEKAQARLEPHKPEGTQDNE